jgi:NAD(P)-dependent dehydrogenase (short-subunit alcohol dehydrogenase family)
MQAAADSVRGKWFIVTGGNSGVGYEAVKALYQKNANVIMASKSNQRGEDAMQQILHEPSESGQVHLMQLDLASFESIKTFAQTIKMKQIPLYALINNAGVFLPPEDTTEEDFEVTLGVNHFGPFLLTHLLLDQFIKPARIVNLGSVAESFGRSDWLELLHGENHKDERSGLGIYGTTKLFNIMLAKEFARRLGGRGIDCFACHPGIVRTPLYEKSDKLKVEAATLDLFSRVWNQSAEDGAISMLRAATDPALQGRGFAYFGAPYKGPAVIHKNNDQEQPTSNPIAEDPEACRKLYEETFDIVSQKEPSIKELKMPEPPATADKA